MSIRLIKRHFAKIGARAEVRADPLRPRSRGVSIDIDRDEFGAFFDIAVPRKSASDLSVIDVRPSIRHLLLMSRQDDEKHKFLCGHDERHWFVAAVPERSSTSTVLTAMEALKPPVVQERLARMNVKRKNRNRRRNKAFIRQGEWFFIRNARLPSGPLSVFRNEPLRRGVGKPHVCEELARGGGEFFYFCPRYPQGVSETEYRRLFDGSAKLRRLQWTVQRRNVQTFVRGKVRHADHKTIVLSDWHQVVMNTETQAVAIRHVEYVD